MRTFLLLILIIFTKPVQAQSKWSRIYGGPNANGFTSVCETNDGGFLMVGTTYSYGEISYLGSTLGNVYIVKIDLIGNMQWQKTLGMGFRSKFGRDIMQAPNGDIFVLGIEKNPLTQDDVFLAKLDSSGNEIWYNTYGGTLNDNAYKMVLEGNDIVIAGTMDNNLTGKDIWISRIANSGTQVWSKTYHLDASEIGNSICKVHDGGYLICGQYLSSTNIYTGLAMRFNSLGDTLWSRILTGTGSSTGGSIGFHGCTELKGDSVFVLTGQTPGGLYSKMNAVRLDLSGNLLSMYVSLLLADIGRNIKPLDDGGFIIVGQYANFGQTGTVYRFSAFGSRQWYRSYFDLNGQSYPLFSYLNSILTAPDGGFVLAGWVTIFNNSSKAIVMKIDGLGNEYKGPAITPNVIGNNSFCEGSTTVLSVPDQYDHYQWFRYSNNNLLFWIPDSDTSSITVDSSRYYRCAMWNENGEFAISGNSEVTVSVQPDSIITSTGPISFCSSTGTTLKTQSIPGNNFQWLYNGTPMVGYTSSSIIPQVSGNYSVQISNACTSIVSQPVQVTVNGPPRLVQSVASIHLPYNNGAMSSCSTAYLSISNGFGATGIEWYHNGNPTGITSSNYNAKKSGYYCVLAQSACGVGWSDTAWVVYDTIFSPLVTIGAGSLTGCANNNLLLHVQNNSGQTPLGYFWYKDGQGLGSGTSSYLPSLYSAGLDSGYYYCVLQGMCGTDSHRTDSIYYKEENSSRGVTFPGGSNSSCTGNPIIIQANQTGASYQWYKDSVIISGAASQAFTVTSTGSYHCSITVACGTYNTTPSFVAIGPPVPAITSNYSAICMSEFDSTIVRLQADAGVPATYKWRLNGVIIPGATSNYYDTRVPGTYDCVFSYSCDTVISNAIQLNGAFISKVISRDHSGRFCPGETVNLRATPGFSYQWYSLNQPISGAVDSIYAASTVGVFYVKISNGLCSVNSNSVQTFQQALADPNSIMPTTPLSFCGNSPVLLKANTRPDLLYQWHLNGQIIPGATQSEYLAFGQGEFQVSLTDSVSCVSFSLPVSMNNLTYGNVTLNVGSALNICSGDTALISVNGNYQSYQWFYNGVAINGALANFLETDSAGTYKVVVSDSSGCYGSAQVQLIVVAPVTPVIFSATPSSCQGSTGKIVISFSSLMNVTWVGPTPVNPCLNVSFCNPTGLLPGWYVATYTPVNGGCTRIDSIEVVGVPNLFVDINEGTGTLCQGANINAGTNYSQYLWSTGQTTYSIAPQSTGWYFLTVTDLGLGCSGIDSSFIVVNPAPMINIQTSGPPMVCSGTPVILDAGAGFSQYLWSIGITSQVISASNTGTYIVTVTEPINGCTNRDTVIVGSSTTPIIITLPSATVDLCQGDSVVISTTPGYPSYIWSDGSTTPSIITNASGTFVVTVSDATGLCTTTDSVIVNVHSLPLISAVPFGATSFCVGDSVELSALGATGSFQWYRYASPIVGATGSSIIVKTRGDYKCQVTDVFSCSSFSNIVSIQTPCTPPQDPIQKSEHTTFISSDNSKVYPNPTSDLFTLELAEGIKFSAMFIYDSSGRWVNQLENISVLDDNLIRCDLKNIVSGIYFLNIIDNFNTVHRLKIVKL